MDLNIIIPMLACVILLVLINRSLLHRSLVENSRAWTDLVAKPHLEKLHLEANADLALKQQSIQEMQEVYKAGIEKFEKQILELEKNRKEDYGRSHQFFQNINASNTELKKETGNLVQALRSSPHAKGQWGEMHLKRALELAGMVDHCDFRTQESIPTQDSRIRPDVIIDLPGGRKIVIDAKVPMDSYLQYIEEPDEDKKDQLMKDHCRQLRRHVSELGKKSYWDQLEGSPEYVALYIPLESLYSSALLYDPNLLEDSIRKRVIIFSPTTLMALLISASYDWSQEKLTQNAKEISTIGKELYDRLSTFSDHFSRLGSSLDKSVQIFNETLGSLDRRVFVQARRFKDLGISTKENLSEIPWIDRKPRQLESTKTTPLQQKTPEKFS